MIGRGTDPSTLTDARRDELIEALAAHIEGLGLATAAILMLEANKPLSFLGGQALLVLQPLLGVVVGDVTTEEYAALLEDRDNVERLILRLERQASHA